MRVNGLELDRAQETSPNTDRFRSIGMTLFLFFALFAGAFVVFVSTAQLILEVRRERQHLRDHVAYVETVYGTLIAADAYDFDRQALQLHLEAVLRFDGIEYVAVRERLADREVFLADAGDPTLAADVVEMFQIPYLYHSTDEPTGVVVEVRASSTSFLEQIKDGAAVFLLFGFLIAISFAAGLYAIIHRYLVVPVVALSGLARALNVESLNGPNFPALGRSRSHRHRDELDMLREGFDDLQTRLKREMAERDKANELYRALFENTHVAMLAIDPEDGRIIRANAAAETFYGWTRDELVSMFIYEINALPPEEVRTRMSAARSSGQGYFEFRHRVADRSIRDVAVHSGIATADGEEVLHSVIVDITARKTAERERDLTVFGMDQSALGVMRIREEDAVVESANVKAGTLLGYTPAELIGMQVYDFDPNMNPESWVQHRQRVRQSRQYQFETVHRRRDGGEYPAEVTVAYIEYEGAEYSFTFFQDITDRKAAEDRLLGLVREKEVLLREVHHRVRNNLLVMSSLISLQTATIKSASDAHDAVEKIGDRIRAMSLAYTAIDESGDVSRINLARFAAGIVAYLNGQYPPNVPVSVTVAPGEVQTDLNRAIPLGLILNELVTNGLKHGCVASEGSQVSISFETRTDALVEVVVADNGRGISPDVLQATQKSLGLMLVELLANQLEGTVTYDVSRGTRVSVTFPAAEHDASAADRRRGGPTGVTPDG